MFWTGVVAGLAVKHLDTRHIAHFSTEIFIQSVAFPSAEARTQRPSLARKWTGFG